MHYMPITHICNTRTPIHTRYVTCLRRFTIILPLYLPTHHSPYLPTDILYYEYNKKQQLKHSVRVYYLIDSLFYVVYWRVLLFLPFLLQYLHLPMRHLGNYLAC